MRFSRFALALLVCGCTAQQPAATSSAPPASTPDATVATAMSATASATPEGVAIGDPELPADAADYLVPLPAFTLNDKEKYDWWSKSGISDNGLRVFVSALPPAEVEARAASYLPGAENKRSSRFGEASFVDVNGSRVASFSEEGSYGVGMMVSPIGPTPPPAWQSMMFPEVDWARHADLLKDKASIVVVASGYGTAGFFEEKAGAGGSAASDVATSTGSPTPSASATP